MIKNMGTIDKIIRILIGIVVAVLIFNGTLSGTTAIMIGLLAATLVVTTFVSFCPIYAIFRISTRGNDGKKAGQEA